MIFITANDVIRSGRAIYHIKRMIEEDGQSFEDGSHIIYVDSSKQDDTDLGRLMHDLHCKEADKFHSKILGDKVRELKETQKGVSTMCVALQELLDESVEVAENRGRAEGMMFMAKNLYQNGNDIDFIASIAGVPSAQVQEWVGAPTA